MYKGILFITISHISLFFTQATTIPYLLYENKCIPISSGAEDKHFSKQQESLRCTVVCVDMYICFTAFAYFLGCPVPICYLTSWADFFMLQDKSVALEK